MAKKIELKTKKNESSVADYIGAIKDSSLKKDCQSLLKIFKKATGLKPKMWGAAIIGFGEYTYYRSNGDEGSFFATGFSARKSGPVIYIIAGLANYNETLKKIGPHKKSKGSCLYLKNLDDVNLKVLEKLVTNSFKDFQKKQEMSKKKHSAKKL